MVLYSFIHILKGYSEQHKLVLNKMGNIFDSP
jgi:hypothetical protein